MAINGQAQAQIQFEEITDMITNCFELLIDFLALLFLITCVNMSTNNRPLQASNSLSPQESPQNGLIALSLDQLASTLLLAHQQAFSTSVIGNEADRIAAEYCRIQQQIIEVVEMRKDMQKMIEMEALQSAHFHSLLPLVQKNIDLQALANQSATVIKRLQSQQIQQTLQVYSKNIQPNNNRESRQDALEVKWLLDDMKRQLSTIPLRPAPSFIDGSQKEGKDSYESTQRAIGEKAHCFLKQEHEERNALNKQVYRQYFQDLSLRQQLLVERQGVFQDYQASSHELVEALLRQREKENNLQRAEHEKHQQLLGVRHRFDIQLQKLSHHQSHLVALYEFDLINLKKHLHQLQGQLRQSQQQTKSLHEDLLASRQHCNTLKQQLEASTQEINREKSITAQLEELQVQNSALREQLKSTRNSGRDTENENIMLQTTVKSLQKECTKLADEKRELIIRSEELQSQLNEAILRSSQSKKMKQELTHKLDDTQSHLAQQKQIYDQMKINLQLQLAQLQHQSEILSKKYLQLEEKIRDQENQKLDLEAKINYLQNELTIAFIEHNRERKELAFQIETNEQSLAQFKLNHEVLTQELANLKARELTLEDWSALKLQLSQQIKKQMQSARKAVDEFAERIHAYCSAES